MTRLSTGVLIIGSGGAGLRAANEALRHGVSVLLITKNTAVFDVALQQPWVPSGYSGRIRILKKVLIKL